jgi:hypothetical protein
MIRYIRELIVRQHGTLDEVVGISPLRWCNESFRTLQLYWPGLSLGIHSESTSLVVLGN